MSKLPSYIGPSAFGIKMGVILPDTNLADMVVDVINKCDEDELLNDGDVICITESVVARSQKNYVTLEEIASEVRTKLSLAEDSTLGIVFPIASRNRFSLVLEALAMAVPKGEIIIQLSWPTDEVGNQIISEELVEKLSLRQTDIINEQELNGYQNSHAVTGIDYIELYKEIIKNQGAKAKVFLCNDPTKIEEFSPDGIVVADIHTRDKTQKAISSVVANNITLMDICSSPSKSSWSEWGLLGSNMSSGGKLKLAPKDASQFARKIQSEVLGCTGKKVEVIIYGDGAYKDPTTGIYELADPKPGFGATAGFQGMFRRGVKYKYLADLGYDQGKNENEIEEILSAKKKEAYDQNQVENEGTTPRQLEDVVASLADLVSGSADAGTPVVLIKGFFN